MAKAAAKSEDDYEIADERRQNFLRVASLRVTNALDKIRLIGKLANPQSYAFDESDIQKIEAALNERTQEIVADFRAALAGEKKSVQKETFSL